MKEQIQPVTVKTFKRMLAPAYNGRIPVLAIGHKGIGKSEVVKAFCQEQGLEYIDIRLAYLEAQDIVGFPYRDEDTGTMAFAAPNWLPEEGNGILFLDEINRARIDVLQAVFQLVRDREIGGIIKNGKNYSLPDGWSIVSAMNPDTPDEQYYVSPMDESLYDRFLKVAVVPDLGDFREYTRGNGFHHEIRSFIAEEEIVLSQDQLPPIEVDATPRSFDMFNILYSSISSDERDLLQSLGQGLIGPKNTEKFLLYNEGFYKEVTALLQEIIESWGDNGSLSKRVSSIKDTRNDMLMALRDHFVSRYITDEDLYAKCKENGSLARFIEFIFSLYDEQIVAFLIAIKEGFGVKRQGLYLTDILSTIVQNPEMESTHIRIVKLDPSLQLDEYI